MCDSAKDKGAWMGLISFAAWHVLLCSAFDQMARLKWISYIYVLHLQERYFSKQHPKQNGI